MPSLRATQKRNDRQNQEDEEQDLRDTRGAGRDATETQHRGDDGYDEKYDGVVKHCCSPATAQLALMLGRSVTSTLRGKYRLT
jgi:hypothetical protein